MGRFVTSDYAGGDLQTNIVMVIVYNLVSVEKINIVQIRKIAVAVIANGLIVSSGTGLKRVRAPVVSIRRVVAAD